jgi:hypothetical protein
MTTIRRKCVCVSGRAPLVTVSRKPVLLCFVIVFGLALISTRSSAQWWRFHTPVDFEECSESAEGTATSKEMRASLISECDAKFAGRRKPGGGYTYYDFMQNRHFDIAGPNPTPEELRQIDQKYTEFLDRRRQEGVVAATFTQQQRQQAELELAKETQSTPSAVKVPIPVSRPQARADAANCQDHPLSCSWSSFAAKIQNFRKNLLSPSKKTNHS